MKRSFLMSALVLALGSAMAMTACGGGTPSADGGGDKPSDSGGGDKPSSGDPVADAKTISDNLQKEIDDAFAPIRNADATLDSIGSLPKDLAKAKGFNKAKLMAGIQAVVGGGDLDVETLGLTDADAKAKVTDRVTKLKALVASIKGADDAAEEDRWTTSARRPRSSRRTSPRPSLPSSPRPRRRSASRRRTRTRPPPTWRP